MTSPERKNSVELERLERLLRELRGDRAAARETEAIREIGLEIAIAIHEVGAMLVNVGWEQTFPTHRPQPEHALRSRKLRAFADERAPVSGVVSRTWQRSWRRFANSSARSSNRRIVCVRRAPANTGRASP